MIVPPYASGVGTGGGGRGSPIFRVGGGGICFDPPIITADIL